MSWNPRNLLSSAAIFDFFQFLVRSPAALDEFLATYVQPKPAEQLLDLGCGVGAALRHIPAGVNYTGIDISAEYIQAARARFGDRGTFITADVADANLKPAQFDCAIAVGVIHHLDDATAHSLLKLARFALRPGRCLFTIDPCYTSDQSSVGRWLTSKDRGRFVRDPAGYRELYDAYGKAEATVVHGLLRLPYTHFIARIDFGGA
jgi:SAM-dependent methyltransferase